MKCQEKTPYQKLLQLIASTSISAILYQECEDEILVYPKNKLNGLGCFVLSRENFIDFKKNFEKALIFQHIPFK
jgi:hypothetical protein